MDKQEQIDKHSCWGHVLFAKSCSPCLLPVWPVITEWLSLTSQLTTAGHVLTPSTFDQSI